MGSRRLNREEKTLLEMLQYEVILLLTEAMNRGNVVIVTLASSPWVTETCNQYFPRVGALLKERDIKIVYARNANDMQEYDLQNFSRSEDIAKFWTAKKQTAIMNEITSFYEKTGSSWKNIISFGDSNFERIATQSSLLDYACTDKVPIVGERTYKSPFLNASKSKSRAPDNHAVSGWIGTHYKRCRCKTVKLFESPNMDDLIREVALVNRWLPYLVETDRGIDINLEDSEKVYAFHKEITGEMIS